MATNGEKIVNYALSQKGKNYTSFGLSDEWCARFVWKCAQVCGFLGTYYSQTEGAGTQPRLSVPAGYGKFYIADGTYKPQKGDCVLYRYSADSNYSDIYHSDHIGLVTTSNNSDYFSTVEGNTNGTAYYNTSVNTFDRYIKSANVHGFYVPNFNLTESEDNYMEIKKGDKNTMVLAYKSLIREAYSLGIVSYNCDETNSFGSGTEKATKEIQKKHNLVVDGIAGPKTITALRNDIATKLSELQKSKSDRNSIIDELTKEIEKMKV